MGAFNAFLEQRKEAIVKRWIEAALSTYAAEAVSAFQRQKDPFANPIGHRLRTGTQEIFEALLDDEIDGAKIRQHLKDIISIRAVQEFSASQALSFIFALKDAIRAALGERATDPQFAPDLVNMNGQIDQIALAAFDIFVECRERLSELRINEIKRQTSWVFGKMNNINRRRDLFA